MLLSEQVRQLESEARLINNATEYAVTGTAWQTLCSYGNITLSEAQVVPFKYDLRCTNLPAWGAFSRLKIGDYYVHGAKRESDVAQTFHGLVWLAAGTYAVVMEGCAGNADAQCRVSNFQLGKTRFEDSVGEALVTYSAQISKTVSSRKLCVGSLKKAVFCVHAFAYTPSDVTNFENPGDNLANGVSISIDGVQVSWSERYQDAASKENAYAKCYYPVTVGSAHTITISKDNANTVVHISVACSPWLLSDGLYEAFTADFPQGSTFYVTLEPLSGNVTKNVQIGKIRAVSFGDSTDYYSNSSGTDILSHAYTFEIVEVGEVGIFLSGLGGCVSIIGVDIR